MHKFRTLPTPAEALNLAQMQWFDLYILESRLPEVSGVDLCRQIRALHPQTPIMFYSSLAYASDIEAGLGAGAQRYLLKPKDIYIINEVVAELLFDSQESAA